jgi:hypothetical protein
MKRVITLQAIAAVLALLSAPAHAAGTVADSRFYAITGTHVYNPPPGTCPSENVILAGMIHVLTLVDPTGLVEIHTSLIDVVGKGAVTGMTYRADGADRLSVNSPPVIPFTGTYNLIPPPSCPHTSIQVFGEVAFQPNGQQAPVGSFFSFNPL